MEVQAFFQRVIVLRSIGSIGAPVGVSVSFMAYLLLCGDNGDGSCFSSAGLPLQPPKNLKSPLSTVSPQLPGKVFQDLVIHSDCNLLVLQIDSVQ